jgi:predicted transcriptional regulator
MPGRKPTKKDLVQMKILNEQGLSPTAIADEMGRSHNTVIKYLKSRIDDDPKIKEQLKLARDYELDDLTMLCAKGRERLHQLIDGGKTRMIETIAMVDRLFNQRRLLEGNSTQNIHTLSKMIESAQESGDNALRSLTIHVNGGQARSRSRPPEPEKTKKRISNGRRGHKRLARPAKSVSPSLRRPMPYLAAALSPRRSAAAIPSRHRVERLKRDLLSHSVGHHNSNTFGPVVWSLLRLARWFLRPYRFAINWPHIAVHSDTQFDRCRIAALSNSKQPSNTEYAPCLDNVRPVVSLTTGSVACHPK